MWAGAYFKLVFTGSTSAYLSLDQSNTPSQTFASLRCSVDDQPYQDTDVSAATTTVRGVAGCPVTVPSEWCGG